ncbi:origin of replication complex subunit 3 isoform X1, partial [Tanacetum coccineum]
MLWEARTTFSLRVNAATKEVSEQTSRRPPRHWREDKLQAALCGDPRRRVQLDLLECHSFLKCSCCSKSSNAPSSSMHDTTLMYTLAQEHGDLINLHDWYQSFRAIILQKTVKERQRMKVSPSPKKRKIDE